MCIVSSESLRGISAEDEADVDDLIEFRDGNEDEDDGVDGNDEGGVDEEEDVLWCASISASSLSSAAVFSSNIFSLSW